MSMTTTGPLPVVGGEVCSTRRQAVLEHMGALCGDRIDYRFGTADAVIDPCHGVLYIVADQEPDPLDWSRICGLLAAVGWDNGSEDHPQDPGEPFFDALSRVYTWRLEWARSCVWCDGKGMSYGCPLCGLVRLRYADASRPGFFSSLGRGGFFMPDPVDRMIRTL